MASVQENVPVRAKPTEPEPALPVEKGPDPEKERAHRLYELIHSLQTNAAPEDVVARLSRVSDINELHPHKLLRSKFPNTLGTTALYESAFALSWRKDSLVRLLLDAGADVNCRNESGEYPLHGAVKKGNKSAVRALIDYGANIDSIIRPAKPVACISPPVGHLQPGWTPLHEAAYCGSETMTRLLLDRGASFQMLDNFGRSPIEIAVSEKHQGPFWALLEFGALEEHERPRELSTSTNVRLWDSKDLSNWVFTSSSLKRPHESLVSGLESIIVDPSSALGKYGNKPQLCNVCSTFEKENNELFKLKLQRISTWLGNATFDSPFIKRCLLCRAVTATLDLEPIQVVQVEEDSSDDSRLLPDRKSEEYPSPEPVDLLYEPPDNCSPVGWKSLITEELASLLDYTETLQDTNTGSKCAFVMAAYWLHTCLTRHADCALSNRDPAPILPTRIIDVGVKGDEREARLCVSNGQRGLYCALSYRWNPADTFISTRRNLEMSMMSLPTEALPPTIRDAIVVTRALGVRYLWVDAICILQDDHQDWNHEAESMASVYRNALFTIAAVDGRADGGGIFRARHFIPRPWRRESSPDDMPGYFDYNHPFFLYSEKSRSRPLGELDTRGWCLQEQILSPRVLSYADGELFWDCMTLSASESNPGGISGSNGRREKKIMDDSNVREFKQLFLQNTSKPIAENILRAYSLWRSAVETFMVRSLTQETDRLIAIKGVSDVVAPYVNDEIVAGLWRGSFVRHLLWWVDTVDHSVGNYAKRPKYFRAPSWSWASVVGKIKYNWNQIGIYRSEQVDEQDIGHRGSPFTPVISIRELSEQSAPDGSGVKGKLVVEGTLIKVFAREPMGGKCVFYSGWRQVLYSGRRLFLAPGPAPPSKPVTPPQDLDEQSASEYDPFEGIPPEYANWLAQCRLESGQSVDLWEPWYADTEDNLPEEMFCFLVAVERNSQLCLCLTPTGEVEGEYRRLGVCSWYLGHVDIRSGEFGSLQTITVV
jgi:hypothetical protein